MMGKMVEEIWAFLQPKLDEKFNGLQKQLDDVKKQLERIENQTKK
jgi:archaellum component FlaC